MTNQHLVTCLRQHPPTTVRMLLALGASKALLINHVDITSAFLHADLDYPIYIEQTHKSVSLGNLVCKLNKALYGLKIAPRRWQQKLRQVLHTAGLKSLNIAKTKAKIDKTTEILSEAFQIRDLGNMKKFLGINIHQDSDGIRIDQMDKIENLCRDMDMQLCRGTITPIADDNLIDCEINLLSTENDASKYRSAVDSLLHIARMTCPDIQYAVNRLSRYVHGPSTNAMLALKHLIRYISRTKSAALFYPKLDNVTLTVSSDSSWGSFTCSKETTGNRFLIGSFPIAWWSKQQTITAQSTCEAEYAALTSLAIAARWIRPVYDEISNVTSSAINT